MVSVQVTFILGTGEDQLRMLSNQSGNVSRLLPRYLCRYIADMVYAYLSNLLKHPVSQKGIFS